MLNAPPGRSDGAGAAAVVAGCESHEDCARGELCTRDTCVDRAEDPALFTRYDRVNELALDWVAVLALPVLMAFVSLRLRRPWMRLVSATLTIVVSYGAVFVWAGVGMSYEDVDLPVPWWWPVGFGLLLLVGTGAGLFVIGSGLARLWRRGGATARRRTG